MRSFRTSHAVPPAISAAQPAGPMEAMSAFIDAPRPSTAVFAKFIAPPAALTCTSARTNARDILDTTVVASPAIE